MDIIIGAIYRHYKGGRYLVLNIAKHTETGEDMVVYENIDNHLIWTRPISMWNNIIDKEKNIKRFEIEENE